MECPFNPPIMLYPQDFYVNISMSCANGHNHSNHFVAKTSSYILMTNIVKGSSHFVHLSRDEGNPTM